MNWRWGRLWLASLVLVGCTVQVAERPAPTTNPTSDSLATVMHIAAQTPSLPPLNIQQLGGQQVTPTPMPTSTFSADSLLACELPAEGAPRPAYTLHAALDWLTKQAQVDQAIVYTNPTDEPLTQLVLHVETNRQIGYFKLQGILADDNQVIENFTLDFTRLTLELPQPLAPYCAITLNISYSLGIPPVMDGYEGRWGYWGFTARQLNLGHWFPMMAPLLGEGWMLPRPHILGEQITAESSDITLELSLENPPVDVLVAGAGQMRELGPNQWEFTLKGGRDLAISVGEGLRLTSKTATDGTIVDVYYFPDSAPAGLTPAKQVLDSAAQAVVLYAELFGAEYPFDRLAIVEGDFPDGMEFSGLVFVGEAWFTSWRGEPNDWITAITVHEVAHQWWYMLVGNDPALYPYMDEALATYSEYLYFQRYYGDLFDWWWDFRVRPYVVEESVVDAEIYQYDEARPYINATYLKGAQMIHQLRTQLGDEAFFAWLQHYLQTQAYQIATPQSLWGLLTTDQYTASGPIRQEFLAHPEILASPTASE